MPISKDETLVNIDGIDILISRKKIYNLNIRVSVPSCDVKVSAPIFCHDEKIFAFISKKIDWIKAAQKQIKKLREEGKIKAPLKFESGEKHYFFGKEFLLSVVKNSQFNSIEIAGDAIEMKVKGRSNFAKRQKILDDFYRKNLREVIPDLIAKYEKIIDVKIAEFGIKKMKTRWGTCNVRDRRIWLNLELAKTSPKYLESIIVHEMTHLLEKRHNKNFYNLMDNFMPDWRDHKVDRFI